ncbi:TPA: hypothetical protein ACH3X1_004347 [Trebouxia sp. C0004]
MADMSSDYQELSLTVKVYDFSLPLPTFCGCGVSLVLYFPAEKGPFFKSLVLLLSGLSAFSQLKAKAESEGIWCDDSPVLCSLCSHIIQQLLLFDMSSGPGFAHCKGWSGGLSVLWKLS